MSASGGVELAASASSIGHGCGADGRAVETTPARLNMMNGPDTELQNCTQPVYSQDNIACADERSSMENNLGQIQDSHSGHIHDRDDEGFKKANSVATNECKAKETTLGDKLCSCNECDSLNKNCHLGKSGAQVCDDTKTDSSGKISKLKTNTAKGNGASSKPGLTNGCCDCHAKDTMLKTSEQGNIIGDTYNVDNREKHKRPNATQNHLGNPTCNCGNTDKSEPLSDLTKMVENICLESGSSQEVEFTSSMEKFKPDPAQKSLSCSEHTAACGDLLAGMDQSFGAIGPAGADLDDAELEELPSSLSDFVLGCHNSQYTVPPCPPNDSDINTIHIETGPDGHPVTLVPYKSEVQMPDIMRLITKDLSEPYSIYTYRYFIHNWPQLCFLAMHCDKCVGAIVCKLDVHKKMARRGYIAMLAVDQKYRKLQIGSSLVKKAIRAMVRGECDEVVLETEITNKPALRLYENLGFLRDKRLFRYYLNGVDALRLKLWLR